MITARLGNNTINCFDGTYIKEDLKKWAKKKIILCPACGKPYEYCHGKVNNPYFRHMDKQECDDKYSEPETEEHISGKMILYNWIKAQDGVYDVVLEGWLPETKQRPDIMFKHDGKQYVLEYQCTPIASEYIERHELYHAAGINDIWILGTEKYKGYTSSERSRVIEQKSIGYLNINTQMLLIESIYSSVIPYDKARYSEYLVDSLILDWDNNRFTFPDNVISKLQDETEIKNNMFFNRVEGIIKNLNRLYDFDFTYKNSFGCYVTILSANKLLYYDIRRDKIDKTYEGTTSKISKWSHKRVWFKEVKYREVAVYNKFDFNDIEEILIRDIKRHVSKKESK